MFRGFQTIIITGVNKGVLVLSDKFMKYLLSPTIRKCILCDYQVLSTIFIKYQCLSLRNNHLTHRRGFSKISSSMACKDLKVKLSSGHYMPMVGLGCYLITGKNVVDVLDRALSVGFRLFDTAVMYQNEEEIGKALKVLLPKHKLDRKDVFITSKLYPSDQGEKAFSALQKSLKRLDCGYIDLYLIHWPGTYGVSSGDPENAKLRSKSWECLVEGVKKGIVKSIGVSNYTVRHLKELLANDYGIKPVVNQCEWHPYCHMPELKRYCEEQGIQLQAYMPLGGSGNKELITDDIVVGIADKLQKTPAQVLLRWLLQQNIAIIPKARSEQHLKENMDLNFTIPDEDMKKLSSMKKSMKYDWDPESIA